MMDSPKYFRVVKLWVLVFMVNSYVGVKLLVPSHGEQGTEIWLLPAQCKLGRAAGKVGRDLGCFLVK